MDHIRRMLANESHRVSKARTIADTIRRHRGYRWVGLYTVDIDRGVVTNIAWSGPQPPEHLTFPLTRGLTSRAIAAKKTVNVGDVTKDPDYLTALETTRSEIIVPVLDEAGKRVVGTIDVESDRPHAFDAAAEKELDECAVVLRLFWGRRE